MTRCSITCAEVGCYNKIFYQSEDSEVPLYCPKHRTDYGRHSAVRELKPIPAKPLKRCYP